LIQIPQILPEKENRNIQSDERSKKKSKKRNLKEKLIALFLCLLQCYDYYQSFYNVQNLLGQVVIYRSRNHRRSHLCVESINRC